MVISFFGGNKPSAGTGMSSAARGLQSVRAYWEGLRRRDGSLPSRSDIDPRGLAPALDQVFVAERIGTGLIRLRIAGMGLTDLAGLDMKGLPLSTLAVPEARMRLAAVVERVFTLPCAVELHLEAERSIGRPALSARLLMLPLLSQERTCDLVLGYLGVEGDIGRAPRRFGISRVIEERLVTASHTAPSDARTPAFAESRDTMRPPVETPRAEPEILPPEAGPVRGQPHLRLVHSAD